MNIFHTSRFAGSGTQPEVVEKLDNIMNYYNNNMIFQGDMLYYCPTRKRAQGGAEGCWHLRRAIIEHIARKNNVITIIITFPPWQRIFKTYLFFVYSYNMGLHVNAETNHCVLSRRTRLVGVPVSSVVMQVSARIDRRCTCTCSSSTPVVHQASSRLCRQLRVHT